MHLCEFPFGGAATDHASTLSPSSSAVSSRSLISRPRPPAVRVGSNQINGPSRPVCRRRRRRRPRPRGRSVISWPRRRRVPLSSRSPPRPNHPSALGRSPAPPGVKRPSRPPSEASNRRTFHLPKNKNPTAAAAAVGLRASAGCPKLNLGLFETFSTALRRQYGTYFRSLLAEM